MAVSSTHEGQTEYFGLFVRPALMRRLDAEVRRAQARFRGASVSRSAVVRDLLMDALDRRGRVEDDSDR